MQIAVIAPNNNIFSNFRYCNNKISHPPKFANSKRCKQLVYFRSVILSNFMKGLLKKTTLTWDNLSSLDSHSVEKNPYFERSSTSNMDLASCASGKFQFENLNTSSNQGQQLIVPNTELIIQMYKCVNIINSPVNTISEVHWSLN